uniref:Protein S100-G-like n=1 Tax=Gouania willdenowi TaxID=441366 RepID=A0A8C5EDP5_GOUWI
MSQLLATMLSLMDIFDRYAANEGDKDTLSKSEVAQLLKNEFPELEPKSKAQVEEMFKRLDLNGDSVVDFPEFMGIVAIMTCMLHGRCTKKCDG